MNWVLLQNSLMVAGATALLATLFGAVVALWTCSLPSGAKRAVLAASAVALALPPFLVTSCWLDLLGRTGTWRRFLPIEIYSLWGTVWVLALLLWPISLFLVFGSLSRLSANQLESEPQLRGWPMIRWLIVPAARGALEQAAILIFVLAINNFAVPAILQTKVFPAEVWVSFNTTFDYRSTLLLSWPMVLFPVLLLAALRHGRISWPRVQGCLSPLIFRERLGHVLRFAAGSASVALLLLALVVPLVDLLGSARTWMELPEAFAAGRDAIWYSLWFAVLASAACLIVGAVSWPSRAGAILWLAFLLPGVLLGIALIYLLNRPSLVAFYQSAGVVILALTLRYSAIGWAGTRQSMAAMDQRLLDFARLNGATALQSFRHVRWPQVAPELAAVGFVIYLLCLWDAESVLLIIPPGCETLALRIFNLLHYGHNAQVNALCVLLLVLAVLPLGLWTAAKAIQRKGAWWLALCVVVGSGCQEDATNQAPVKSKLFSKVEVIGTRGTALGQFNKPRSLAVDAMDNVYVVDMTGRVQKFSSNGVFLTSWQMPQTELGKPKGMCRDADGNIAVIEPHYNRVTHFSPEGKQRAMWGKGGTNQGELCMPRAIAVDRRGRIFVCEYTLVERVQRFTPDGATATLAFGNSGLLPGQFNRPEGIAVDSHDRVYVADSCNHRIQVFSTDGQFIRQYGRAGRGTGQLSYPYDVQVDAAGLQFVAEFGNSRVQVFDDQGESVEILGGPGTAPGQFSNPWSLALDSAGNLYVADSQNHRVQKFIRKVPLTKRAS